MNGPRIQEDRKKEDKLPTGFIISRDTRSFRPNPSDRFGKIFDYKARRKFPEYDQKFDYSYELSDLEEKEELKDHPHVENILDGLMPEKRVKLA